MLNDTQIRQEIERSEGEHRRLKRNIEEAERDSERNSRKIQAAKNDIETAERNLEKQKQDLERVLNEFKYAEDKLTDLKRKESEYEKKIGLLEFDLKRILKEIETTKQKQGRK